MTNATETAKILGISKKRLRELGQAGLVPVAWRGKPVRYSVPKVLDWLDKSPPRKP